MKNHFFIAVGFFLLLSLGSCIDRDSISGTGKEEPERIYGYGGSEQTGRAGQKLSVPFTARVVSAENKPIRNILVTFSLQNGSGILSDSVQRTDLDGYAKSFLTCGSLVGNYVVQASVPGLKGNPITFTASIGAASIDGVNIYSGDNQSGSVASTLPQFVTAFVGDKYGNPVKDVVVYFLPVNGQGSLQPNIATTNASGIAYSNWTLDTVAGVQTCEARIGQTTNGIITFHATATALRTSSSLEIVSGDNQFGIMGRGLSQLIVVRARDKYKNIIPFFTHSFSVLKGGGSVIPSSKISDENGIASTQYMLGFDDSLQQIKVYNPYQSAIVTATGFRPVYFDSVRSNNGLVLLYWGVNRNGYFENYKIYRNTQKTNFEQGAVYLATITDKNVRSYTDSTATAGILYYYNVQMNFYNGLSFFNGTTPIVVNP